MPPPPFIVGDSSPFLKRVLVPFWVVRILVMLVQIGTYGLVIAGLGVFRDDVQKLWDEYNTHLDYDAVLAVSCVIVAIILLCLILDIVCIIMRGRRTLSPPFFLGVNITQSVFYVVNFVLTMVNAHNGVLSIVIGVIILLSFLGLLVYAAIIYHKYRTGSLQGAYEATSNPEVHSLVTKTGFPGPEAGPAAPGQTYAQDYTNKSAYYDPQAAGEAQAYGGQGYPAAAPSPAPQAYEPYSSAHGQQDHRARSQSPEQARPFVQQGGSAV